MFVPLIPWKSGDVVRQIWPAANVKTMETVENLSRANAKAQMTRRELAERVHWSLCAAHRLTVVHRSQPAPADAMHRTS